MKQTDNRIDVDKAAHRIVEFHTTSIMCSGTVTEGDWIAFYHESRLYSVKNRKTGIIYIVYASNPYEAIERAKTGA